MPPYTMKPLHPTQGDTIKPKRVRKPAARKAAVVPPDVPVLSLQMQSTTPTVSDSNNGAQPLEPSVPTAGPSTQAPFPHAPAARQKKQTKTQSALPKVACGSCGQSDVPLVRGGSEYFWPIH